MFPTARGRSRTDSPRWEMRRRRTVAIAVAGTAFALVAGGCGVGVNTKNSVAEESQTSSGPVVTSSLDNGATVPAGTQWTLTAASGWSIRVNGPEVARTTTAADGSGLIQWQSRPLPPGKQITAAVEATSSNGTSRTESYAVTTGAAKDTFGVTFNTDATTKYGVGEMPKIEFDISIPKKARANVVSHLTTTVTPRNVPVAFRWIDDRTVAYRPEKFWPGHAKITVAADISAVPISSGGRTYWGKNRTTSWRTGKSMIIRIQADRHQGYVIIDGKKARTFGTSVGKSGYTTRSGTKTLTDKFRVTRMTNIGVTSDEIYDLEVPYAMRLTETGEFLHAAPWNGNIGYANTSHGCTNLNYSDAAWIFERAQWGDPVVTTGTSRSMETWNGPGAMWNVPWKQWRKS